MRTHREQYWLHYSKVHQSWGQEAIHYTMLEVPSCQMNRNWPYWYTANSTLFAVYRYLSESIQSPTRIECFSGFLSQETGTDTFSTSSNSPPPLPPPPPSPSLPSPVTSFSCKGSFFFGQSSKCLTDDRLRCEHRCFYMATSVRLVSHILADPGPRGTLLTKQTSFLAQPYARLARTASRNFASLFSPATILRASLYKTHIIMRVTPRHYQTERLRSNSGQTEWV